MAEIDANLHAIVTGRVAPSYPEDGNSEVALDNMGNLQVAQGVPELTSIVRLGQSYQVANSAGQAALTALPTTVAGLTLWNGEPGNGKSYLIDSFGSWEAVVDATQTDVTAIFACCNKTPVTAPTDAALAIRSLSGRSNYGGKGRTVAGGTIVNDGWFPHGTNGQMAAAAAGAQWKVNEVQAHGLYLIPPGGAFNIQAVKAAAAAAAQQFFFVRWHEVQILFQP